MHPRVFTPIDMPPPGNAPGLTMFANDATGSGLALVDLVVQRGSEPPLHRYQHQDLGIYVLDGDVTFHVADRHLPATSGDCVLLPRGTEHGYTVGSERARLLVVLAPPGAEQYLTELHDPQSLAAASGGTAVALERLIATAARYGIEITGPRPD
jgi:quercetin dioxygenase-like cupin family protein